ncbi:hypothetical protein J0X19_17575 [Hymenobacter sp. BT186]|uniref:Uncharacterized protein n=1 Tax=Hymenobacter telluris TaxID=2816474 RepID=A0A939EZ03_9BACT|nr:hypothetical protein [Hymenobacter telluris]MBO0359776.1 hypothetical protein [Hymenobacter telluris]MBW3375803.1 hypothetical protein [Hymenobacter norwichensis]
MAEPTNPLFEDEKEFLERQKLEYERALLGEVEEIKEKTQQIGKYVAIGAGVLTGVWALSKLFGGKKKYKPQHDRELGARSRRASRALRKPTTSDADLALGDDLGLGSHGHHNDRGAQPAASERAHIAPDVYHTESADLDTDPFRPLGFDSPRPVPARNHRAQQQYAPDDTSEASSIVADAFRSFLQSDTGKMLVAQATAVLMAVVAKKVGEYLPMFKNPDLATSPSQEPETRDIDFTYHHDEAHAPHQPL